MLPSMAPTNLQASERATSIAACRSSSSRSRRLQLPYRERQARHQGEPVWPTAAAAAPAIERRHLARSAAGLLSASVLHEGRGLTIAATLLGKLRRGISA